MTQSISHFLGRWAAALVLGAVTSVAHAAVTDCDRLASHPADPDRVAPGLAKSQIDLPAAVAACSAAVAADPRHARSRYLLGRVLTYSGKVQDAIPHLQVASDTGYRQAIFVLGYLYVDELKPHQPCRAGEAWLRSAALDHPWSGYYLVEAAMAGRFAGCAFQLSTAELERLLVMSETTITVEASRGRIEKLRAQFNAWKATLPTDTAKS